MQVKLPRVVAGVMRWGKWGAKLSTAEYRALIEGCLENDVSAFDHADIYGDYTEEAAFGKVLAQKPGLRQNIQLISKCGIKMMADIRPHYKVKSYDSGKAHILASVDSSLRSLRTDYLDVLLLHRPDMLMKADEIAEAFTILKEQGKVNAFGVSNFTPSQFELLKSRWPELITNQLELSLTKLEALTDGSLDQAQQHKLKPMIWSPLGGGKLISKDSPASTLLRKLHEIAERHEQRADVIAYAWVLMHPTAPTVVTGSSKLKRILRAKKALSVMLTKEEWYELLEASRGLEVA